MEKKVISMGWFIIASALIWGITMIACAIMLRGTDGYMKIQLILGTGAALHLMLIWVPLATRFGKKKMNKE